MSDANFKQALLKLIQDEFADDAVEIVSYEDAGYKNFAASYCGFGTCFDEEWATKVTYLDNKGREDYDYVIGKLPELLERLGNASIQ